MTGPRFFLSIGSYCPGAGLFFSVLENFLLLPKVGAFDRLMM